MSKIAVVFPGQGAQYVTMGKDFYDEFDEVKNIFEKANQSLGFNLSKIMFEGPEDELKLTYNTQPALTTMSIAIWELIKDKINADAFAGHSLGEYPAIVAAGGMSFEDAVVAVHNRGKFMQEAVPVGVGAMSAIMGASIEKVIEVCKNISTPDSVVEPANFNSPSQIVVAGNKEAVEKFNEEIKKEGAKRVIPLEVSAPFHCSLMKPAEEKMAKYLENIEIKDLKVPVYSNVKAEKELTAKEVKENLISQVSNTVKWTNLIENMINDGFDIFIEVGAGTVLSGLIKKINRKVKCINISKLDDLSKLEELNV
jgi:[acyl-carrier-protein] S-malonyltransferase